MESEIKVLSCPQCGAAVQHKSRTCSYCGSEFVVSSPSSLAGRSESAIHRYVTHYQSELGKGEATPEVICALGLCYLELALFDNALREFERCIETVPTHADAYLYASFATLRGRRPKSISLREMEKMESYLSAGRQLAPERPEFPLALGLAKYDFYVANGLRVRDAQPEDLISSALARMNCQDDAATIARKMRLENVLAQYL